MRFLPVNTIVICAVLFLQGCAFLHSLDKDLDKQVDAWVKEHEYTKALDALSFVRKTHPKYNLLIKKQAQVVLSAEAYEKKRLKRANDYIDKQRWHDAEKILNEGMQKLPDSEKLQTAYREFIKQRAYYLKSLYYQLYINKAEWLVKNQDVNRELARTIPRDRDTKKAMQQYKDEIQHVYQQLVVCGIEGMNIGDLDLAEQCFLLADELKPSIAIQTTIIDIQQQLAKHEKRKTVKLSSRGRHLLDKAKREMQAGKFKKSIKLYKSISSIDKRHGLVKAFKQELDNRINTNVSQGIEVGRKLYSQGEVEQALAVWYDLKEIAPKNEYLLSHIDRAKRVLNKLKKIRKKDSTITPPSGDKNTNG